MLDADPELLSAASHRGVRYLTAVVQPAIESYTKQTEKNHAVQNNAGPVRLLALA